MKKALLFLCSCILSLNLLCQHKSDSLPERDGKFTSISAGLSISPLRDKGTSPLLYTGIMGVGGIDYKHYKNNHLWQFRFLTPNGVYLYSNESDFFITSGNNFDFDFSYEHNINKSDNKTRYYLGGSLENLTTVRTNSKFMNAGFALNNISSMSFNAAIEHDFFIKAKERKLFFFLKCKRKEKHYYLRGKVGLPLFAMLYRPGYTHVGNATLDYQSPFAGFVWDHKLFPGLNTDVSITRLLKNGNQFRYSYIWNALTTGSEMDNRLDIANHIFMFSLIVNLD